MNIIDLIQLRLKVYVINMDDNHQNSEELKGETRGIYCVAWGCSNRSMKGSGLKFHRFPLKNMDLLKKWIVAMRREDFAPTSYSRICGEHFLPTDYYHSTSNFLRKDAVPSEFNFLLHLQKESAPSRRELKRKMPCEIDPPKGPPPPPPPSAKEPTPPPLERAIKVRDCSVKKGGENIETKGKEKSN